MGKKLIKLLFDTLMLNDDTLMLILFLALIGFPEGKFKYHRNKNCLSVYEN